MPAPRVLLEIIAFWIMAPGVYALVFRKRVTVFMVRLRGRSIEHAGQRALNLSVTFGALLLIDLGLGGLVSGFVPLAMPVIAVAALVIAVALVIVLITNIRAARSQFASATASAGRTSSVAPGPDEWEDRDEPYAGIVESILARGLVDDAAPDGASRRNAIHRLVVVATVVFALGAMAIVAMMVIATIGIFSW